MLKRLGVPETSPLLLPVGGNPGALKLAFGSASPDLTEADVGLLVVLGQRAATAKAPSAVLARARRFVPLPERQWWSQGYRLANEFHEHAGLDIDNVAPVDVHATYAALGIIADAITLDDDDVRGVTLAMPGHSPLVVLNVGDRRNDTEVGRRFTLAHELCHVLYDSGMSRPLGVVDGPWAPDGVEQRANSFAAMFLMPTALVQKLRHDLAISSVDALAEALASRMNVSRRSAHDHVLNLHKNGDLIVDE